MPHVVYIAWGFPPSRSGGAYRQLATANALAAAGWDVTVLTVDRTVFTQITGADLSLEERIDPRVEVVRTPFPWPLRNPDRSTWSLPHRALPRVWRKCRIAAELALFPEPHYSPWLRPLGRALREVERRQHVDLVLASGNPHVAFAAAYGLHRSTGVPYVLDYRDAWLLDVFTGRQAYPDWGRRARWERRVMGRAAQAWFVNGAIRDWHAARYPDLADRFLVVPNGWDPDLLGAASADLSLPDAARAAPAGSRPLTFGYLGTMSSRAPMAAAVEGWREAKRRGLIPAEAVFRVGGYLGFFGGEPDVARDPVAAAVLGSAHAGVEYAGPVPKAEVGAFYGSLDALVLPIDAGPFVTSGKVFEYAATGKPIVALCPADAGAAEILDGYPLLAPDASLAPEGVAAAFGRAATLVDGLTAEQTEQARAFGARFRRDRQLGPAIAGLADLLA